MSFPNPLANQDLFSYDMNMSSGLGGSQSFIQSLELSDLLKNEHVRQLFNRYQEATSQVVKASEMQKTLWNENTRLTSELQSTSAELQSLKASGC